jgi:hypothetical protein
LATIPPASTTLWAKVGEADGHSTMPSSVSSIVWVCNSRLVPLHQRPDECAAKARRNHHVSHKKLTLSAGKTPGTWEESRVVNDDRSHHAAIVRHATATT